MVRLLLVALVGLLAQLVDGSMGMAYGVTSSSLLILFGFSPAMASASLHLAEVGTTLASGLSHRKLGNVDTRMMLILAIPGAVGGFVGAMILGSFDGEVIKPFVSMILLTMGCTILWRFSRPYLVVVGKARALRSRFLVPLGLIGGLCDAIGGGGWGPIVTSTLLARTETAPRRIVGSVSLSEFAVATAASIGFFVGLGKEGFSLPWTLALMGGGVLAAPLAAWMVGRISRNVLGVLVGGVILLTNLRTILRWSGATPSVTWAFYAAVVLLTFVAWLRVRYTGGRRVEAARDESGEDSDLQVVNLGD